MNPRGGLPLPLVLVCTLAAAFSSNVAEPLRAQETARATALDSAQEYIEGRRANDYAALMAYRPGYTFWRHIFTIPDGSIAFGSAVDGRLLAVLPAKGDWTEQGEWKEPDLPALLYDQRLATKLDDRRDQVAALLEGSVGPVLHNPTRGQFLLPNARRYGGFLREWGAIYERFGVPADIGLAQAIIESGLNPTRRSESRAIGFCQWLSSNWRTLDRLSPDVIEVYNQTTQAPFCAAYLSVLATKYGSFIPALSEHHSGGTNVGRTLINGERLGGGDIREQYFLGSQFARDLRQISLYGYKEIYRTYGPRSYLYSEMVFGNTLNVTALMESTRQVKIYAMRTTRQIPLTEITKRAGLPADEVKRFNPALTKRVPADATLYLPVYVKEFGRDVSFWHRPPAAAYAAVLNDFVRLDAQGTPSRRSGRQEQWDDPAFESVLRGFQQRFAQTNTEEGTVMATVLAYAIGETYSSDRGAILAEFRSSDEVRRLFERAIVERGTPAVAARPAVVPASNEDAR